MTPLAATRWRQEGHEAAPCPGLAPLTHLRSRGPGCHARHGWFGRTLTF